MYVECMASFADEQHGWQHQAARLPATLRCEEAHLRRIIAAGGTVVRFSFPANQFLFICSLRDDRCCDALYQHEATYPPACPSPTFSQC